MGKGVRALVVFIRMFFVVSAAFLLGATLGSTMSMSCRDPPLPQMSEIDEVRRDLNRPSPVLAFPFNKSADARFPNGRSSYLRLLLAGSQEVTLIMSFGGGCTLLFTYNPGMDLLQPPREAPFVGIRLCRLSRRRALVIPLIPEDNSP